MQANKKGFMYIFAYFGCYKCDYIFLCNTLRMLVYESIIFHHFFKKQSLYVACVVRYPITDALKQINIDRIYKIIKTQNHYIYLENSLSLTKYLVIRTLYKELHYTEPSYNVSVFYLYQKC